MTPAQYSKLIMERLPAFQDLYDSSYIAFGRIVLDKHYTSWPLPWLIEQILSSRAAIAICNENITRLFVNVQKTSATEAMAYLFEQMRDLHSRYLQVCTLELENRGIQ